MAAWDQAPTAEEWKQAAPVADKDPLSRERLTKDATTEGELRLPGMDSGVRISGKPWQFLVSTGRGMIDLWAGGKQVALEVGEKAGVVAPGRADEYTAEQEGDLQQYEKIQREAPGTTMAGRITGQIAPTLLIPAGGAARGVNATARGVGLPGLAKAGLATDAALVGGLQGFMNFVPEGESRLKNTLYSAAAGGAITKGVQFAARPFAGVVRGKSPLAAMSEEELDATRRLDLPKMAGTQHAMSSDELSQALKSEGIDWGTLPSAVREELRTLADDAAVAGAAVTPGEMARVVRAKNLPGGVAQLTKGQMTRDPNQLRTEFNLRRTAPGLSLEQQLMKQDEVLANSLDVIKFKTGGTTSPGRDAEAGRKITQPLLDQLKSQQGKVDALYAVADASGETAQKVDPQPLINWIEDNFAAMHSAPAMKSLVAQMKKSGLVTVSDDGVAAAGREPTVRELEELRKAMNKWGKADDASGHWMGEAKRVIDGITEGKGGELYGKARAARIALREQFEDPGIINALVGTKRTGDRLTEFDEVFRKSVLNSSPDELVRLRDQLLQTDKPELTSKGVQAFKDLRSATLDYLKLGALNNAKDEWSHAGFKKAVESIGPEKLEALFGKNTANQIQSVVESSKDMKAVFNKTGIYNPGTASAIVDWLDKITGLVGLGRAASYSTTAAKNLFANLHAGRAAEEASRPLESASKAGKTAKDAHYKALINLYAGKAGATASPGVAAAISAPESEQ